VSLRRVAPAFLAAALGSALVVGVWPSLGATGGGVAVAAPPAPWALPVQGFRLIDRVSGPVNYYRVLPGPPAHIHSRYEPGFKTAVVGYDAKEWQVRASRLHWRWRAVALPTGGDECQAGKGDSAAVVYVSWKRAFRYYTLKYVWSAVGRRGAVCDKKRNPLLAQDTVILESGSPLREWKTVDVDLRADFRRHFEGGDASAEVPDLFGIGLMSDGDQTQSVSSADFADFSLQ
jgi:hypothetical protein